MSFTGRLPASHAPMTEKLMRKSARMTPLSRLAARLLRIGEPPAGPESPRIETAEGAAPLMLWPSPSTAELIIRLEK